MAAEETEKGQQSFDDRINSKIFDRQIRHWGLEAQKKLLASHVLVVGMSGINVEAAKDMALAGIRLTVVDGRSYDAETDKFNYLVSLSADGPRNGTVAAESAKGLKAIASLIDISELPQSDLDAALSESQESVQNLLKKFSCVLVAAELSSAASTKRLEAACQEMNIGFVVSHCCGTLGYFVQCFGKNEYVVSGKTVVHQHPSFTDTLRANLGQLNPKTPPQIFAVVALLRWHFGLNNTCCDSELEASRTSSLSSPFRPLSQQEASSFQTFSQALFSKETGNGPSSEHMRILDDISEGYGEQSISVSTVVGGLIAQEIRKYSTKDQIPVCNVAVFDSFVSSAVVASVPFTEPPGISSTTRSENPCTVDVQDSIKGDPTNGNSSVLVS